MKSLKVPLIALFIFVAVVFNIEVMTFDVNYVLELHRFVDILILTIIVLSLFVRALHKLPAYANVIFWIIVYFGFWFFANKTGSLQINLLVTTFELIFVSAAVLLAREVATRLFEVESTLDRLVFASFRGRTLSMNDAAEEVTNELVRSRRYQRSLTVLVLEPDPATIQNGRVATVEEIQNNLARRYAMGKISEVISSTARRPDLVIKQEQSDRFILLCPETTAASSEILRQRIHNAVKTSLGVSMSIGVASFPDDALTFEELLHKASAKLIPLNPSVTPAVRTDEADRRKS